jgi:polysaccharide deacetylase family protein (PEP-CTERM system associated)
MNILTIDLEDWFHIIDIPSASDRKTWNNFESRVEANSDRILEALEEQNIKATWFCLGWIAEKYPSLIRRISERHEVGIHSMYHELLPVLGKERVIRDISDNIKIVEDITGKKINSYRAPGFSFDNKCKWLIEVLVNAGVEYDCSVFTARRNHGGFENFPSASPCRIKINGKVIKEFPMTIVNLLGKNVVFSGGGYFRLMPYSVVNSWMKKSDYNMTYFHPRDFDAGQPVLSGMSMKRKFMSYTGLKNSFSKFKRLLIDHKFVTVGEAGTQIDWEQTPLIKMDEL